MMEQEESCVECGEPASVESEGTMSSGPFCFTCWKEKVEEERFNHSLGLHK